MKEGRMKVQIDDVSTIEKRLSIEVPVAMVERELARAYAALSHEVKVPGFRPGKVPRRILEQRYKMQVEADVAKRVQSQAFFDAVKEHKVPAVGRPHMTGGQIVAQQPFSFTARVEIKPSIVAKDYKGLSLKRIDRQINDEKVNEQIEKIRQNRSTVEPVSDRQVVQHGDMAKVDFDATIDGAAFEGNTGRDVNVEVIDGELARGDIRQLEGANIGDTREVDYTFPADHPVATIQSKAAKFKITVKSISAKKTPELNDEFAKSLGFESVDALKAKVRSDLEKSTHNRADSEEREDILKKLIEKNTFEVPNSLIDRGIDMMLETAMGSMMRSGVDPRTLNLDWAKIREEFRPRAEVEVRGQLVLEAIGKNEGVVVSDADFEKKYEELSAETGAPLSTVKARLGDADSQSSLTTRIIEEKALAFVKANATFEG